MVRVALFVCVVSCLPLAHAATSVDGKPNNPYGVMLGLGGGDHSDFLSLHLDQAAEMCGTWAHVRIGSEVHGPDLRAAIRALVACRAKRLRPVMTGLYVPSEYRRPEPGLDHAPFDRDDGYPLAAARYAEWARGLARVGAYPPYYELGNEINGKWDPGVYGKFITAISQALKQELPQMKMVSAGLAGNGGEFLEGMLRAQPGAAGHIDAYGLHPYGANHPPAYTEDGYCLRGHQWTAEHLARVGVRDPLFVMTESGYELGNKRDARYPRITDRLRGQYLVEAYKTFWEPDPSVVCLTLFMLQATNYPGWHGWVMLHDDNTPTETYKMLAALPKPEGSDWMPQGERTLSGRVTLDGTGEPVPHVFVYTVPGLYAAETDADGRYTIQDVPEGTYTIDWFRDGFERVDSRKAANRVMLDISRTLDFSVRMRSLAPDMDSGERIAKGWTPLENLDQAGNRYAVDRDVAFAAQPSQRIGASPGGSAGLWAATGYATAIPGKVFSAEVMVKTRGLVRGAGRGPVLEVSITDSGAQPYSTAAVALPPGVSGDQDWTPLCLTVASVPVGRRLVMRCLLEAEEGMVWFARPFLQSAQLAPPSRADLPQSGEAVVRGEVMARSGERQMGATVWLRPGNYWAQAASDGTFAIEGVPAGTYDLWAMSHGLASAAIFGVTLAGGQTPTYDLVLPALPRPSALINPDFEQHGPEVGYIPGWTRYGEFDGFPRNGWQWEHRVPEHEDGFFARTGEGFAGSLTGSNVKNGGIYQVLAVEPETVYEASVWIYTYQTDDGMRGDVASRIGLDPTGGTDPGGSYVVWSPAHPSHKAWTRIAVAAKSTGDRMTVLVDQRQVVGCMFLANLYDDVGFRKAPDALPAAFTQPEGIGYPHADPR